MENACAVIQQEESHKDVFNSGLPVIESTALLSKSVGKDKCSICGFNGILLISVGKKWAILFGIISTRIMVGQINQERFENLMRNVLKGMKPGASGGDCTYDELEFVAGMVCLNAATINAVFYWILDTGATDHMTPYYRDMINAKILEILPKITLPNGDSSEITQFGQVRLENKEGSVGRKIRGLYHLLNVPTDQVDAKLIMEVENSTSLFSCSAGVYNKTMCPNLYSLWHHRATWTYLMVHKSDALEIIKAFLKFVELHFSTKVPDNSHLRVFGCFAVATNPSRVIDKFSPRGVPCVFIGYPTHQKGYKLYNLLTHASFSANTQNGPTAQEETVVLNTTEESVSVVSNTPEVSSSNVPTTSTTTNTEAPVRKSSRSSKPPSWTKDFVVPTLKPSANQLTTPTLSSQFFFCFLSTLVNQQDPKGFEEAVKDPGWCDVMNAELRALEENETWELADLPPNKKAIGNHWIYKTKLKSDGSVERKKSKLVVQGNRQMKGVDYDETFAPVAKMMTVMSLLAVAAMQGWDITQMDGENVQDSKLSTSKVCKLKKSLCGLKQAPRQWFAKLCNALLSFGYKQSKAYYSLFTKTNVEDLGALHYFLGLEVTKADFGLFVSQKKYTLEMLQDADVLNSRPYKLPMDPNLKLQADNPTSVHMQAVKHLMRYLFNSPGQGILLAHHSKVQLTAYCDSDWGSFPMTRRSTTGYCILLGDSPISWKSKKQDLGLKDLHPVTLHCDNQEAIHIAVNPVFHARTKHIEVDCHYVRDQVKDGQVKPVYLHTSQQLANVFTKVLTTEQHLYLLNKLGVSTLDTTQLKGEYKDKGDNCT
nr:retrovirus-related Pol polyprotein from transposon TNT 1-94 [Tanacetum cinerariifolium]